MTDRDQTRNHGRGRGHGDSEWSPDGVYSFSRRVEDLQTVLQSVRSPYAVVGAVLGGITSLQTIADGLRPAALVLVDIVLRPQRSGVERIGAFMKSHPNGFASLKEAVEMVAAYNPHRARPAAPEGLLRNLRPRPDGRLRWHWDPRIVETDLDEDLAAMDAMFDRLPSDCGLHVLLVRGSTE